MIITIKGSQKEELLLKQLIGMQKHFKFDLSTKEDKRANNLQTKSVSIEDIKSQMKESEPKK